MKKEEVAVTSGEVHVESPQIKHYLAVMNGKGGTGKTTVMAALAQLAGRVMIADCDVEAPNLHLILKPRVTSTYTLQVSSVAVVDPEKCSHCVICEEYCMFGAVHGSRPFPQGLKRR